MAFREWFRPPRHVLTIFLSVAVVSAVALGWLSWLLVEQDRALDVQRRQERLEQAADHGPGHTGAARTPSVPRTGALHPRPFRQQPDG